MSSIVIAGDVSGSVTLQAPSVAGSTILTLPATSGTVQTSGAGFTTNGVAYASSTSALATGSALTFNGSNQFTVIPATGTAYNRTESTQYSTWLQTGVGNANVFWEFSAGTPVRWVDTSAGELMRLTSTGLGIGTSSPSVRLDVVGSSGIRVNEDGSGTKIITIRSDWAGVDPAINVTTNNSLLLMTNNTERARITSGGYFKASNTGTYQSSSTTYHELRNDANANTVRISNTIASGYTDAVAQIAITGYSPNTTNSWFLFCNDSTATRAEIRSNGGIANYSANDVNLSDRREKTNFAPAGSYLDKICAIPVQTFNYIDQNLEEDGGLTLGVVAQDVQAVAPELVMESNWAKQGDEPKMRLSIYQTDLQYALMKCIQEQQVIIESLKARLDAANL